MEYKSYPIVSVVIPVYNCEEYMVESVRSLMEQTWENIEYIFIDDLSTDNSIQILEEVVSCYPNRQAAVRIIKHSQNKGVAYSRIEGVRESKGEMIIHCDSDDIVEKDAYEIMVKRAMETGADIVGCGFKKFGCLPSSSVSDVLAGEIKSLDLLSSIGGSRSLIMHGALWNKMIRRQLWDNVVLPTGLSYCEDVAALFQILKKNPKVVYVGKVLYNYRIRESSLIQVKDTKMFFQCELLIPFLEQQKLQDKEEYNRAIEAKIVNLLYRLLKSKNIDLKSFAQGYGLYKNTIPINKQMNILEKLHLKLALDGVAVADLIGELNNIGYLLIRQIRKMRMKFN